MYNIRSDTIIVYSKSFRYNFRCMPFLFSLIASSSEAFCLNSYVGMISTARSRKSNQRHPRLPVSTTIKYTKTRTATKPSNLQTVDIIMHAVKFFIDNSPISNIIINWQIYVKISSLQYLGSHKVPVHRKAVQAG